jgi:hypothetical protein
MFNLQNSADGRRKPKPADRPQIKIAESPFKHHSTKTYPKETYPTECSQENNSANEDIHDEEIASTAENGCELNIANKQKLVSCDSGRIVAM